MSADILNVETLASRIPDGATLAIARDQGGAPMTTIRALIRRGARDLHLIGVPVVGIGGDMLIGAGCVRTYEGAGVTLGEYGAAPRFVEAVREGRIALKDSTCPAIHAALQAGEKGLPFMPLRGILGTDILRHRPEWKTIDNPFAASGGDPIVLLPALRPDIALIHAAKADRLGNVWIGRDRELMTMAHAAKTTLATVEEIVDGNLMEDELRAAATIPALYVGAVAEAKGGSLPIAMPGHYGDDDALLRDYVQAAKSRGGFEDFLVRFGARDRVAA